MCTRSSVAQAGLSFCAAEDDLELVIFPPLSAVLGLHVCDLPGLCSPGEMSPGHAS